MEKDFHYQTRVYYEDTDAEGVVYYANYLKWMERARTEWLHTLGLSLADLKEEGRVFAVHRIEVTYHLPARLEDSVSISCQPANVGLSRMHVFQHVERDGAVLAEATVVLAILDSITFKPARLPKVLRERLLSADML